MYEREWAFGTICNSMFGPGKDCSIQLGQKIDKERGLDADAKR
jgi:hypothetical protein